VASTSLHKFSAVISKSLSLRAGDGTNPFLHQVAQPPPDLHPETQPARSEAEGL